MKNKTLSNKEHELFSQLYLIIKKHQAHLSDLQIKSALLQLLDFYKIKT